MKRLFQFAVVGIIATEALVIGQGSEATRVLNEMRAALGGDKLAAVRNFIASGRSARSAGQFQLTGEFEIFCELPDKYVKKETISMGGMGSAASSLGFNGDTLLQESSAPGVVASGGGTMMYRVGPGGAAPGGASPTPEQQAAMKANALKSVKTDFTRLTVALFGASFSGNPVEFSYGGTAESPDGKADVIDVKGPNEFAARLYIDGRTHRPLMMSWQAPGATIMTSGMSVGGARPGGQPTVVTSGGGGSSTFVGGGAGGAGAAQGAGMEDRMKALQDAAKKLVEHRFYFSEYRDVDGVKLPHQIVRAIDGQTSEEITYEKFRLNTKIDEKKFKN